MMDNEKLVRRWQSKIIAVCEGRLGRELTTQEQLFVTSRGGFIALEIIEDSVSDASAERIEELLNSETK